MFSDEHFYEAKVFLRSYKDAFDCVKQSAEKSENLIRYERLMERITDLKKNNEIAFKEDKVVKGPQFQNSREVQLFRFSNYLFKKYLPGFDSYSGDFVGLKKILGEGIEKMKKDLEVAHSVA